MDPSIKFELDQLTERLNAVRYFYALGHGGNKQRKPILDRIADVRARLEALGEENKAADWTTIHGMRLETAARHVCGLEQEAIGQQVIELSNKLGVLSSLDRTYQLGLQAQVEHVSELIAQSQAPVDHSNELPIRIACLRHADLLMRAIKAFVRLHGDTDCYEPQPIGVRQTEGGELYFLELRLENVRVRSERATSTADRSREKEDRTHLWARKLRRIWELDEPNEKTDKLPWYAILKTIATYEDDLHTIERTREAYEQERNKVIETAHEIIADGRRTHPVYQVSNDLREDIRQFACRFLRPVDSERLNRVDCAVWTKLVTVLEEIHKDYLSAQAGQTSEVATTSAHQPIARVPGVGVEVISGDRRRPWEL